MSPTQFFFALIVTIGCLSRIDFVRGAEAKGSKTSSVAEVEFSRKRSLCDEAFELQLTTKTKDAIIRYTTNGLPPTLTNGLSYGAPIRISQTTVLRAAAFKEGRRPSKVKTHSFLFPRDVIRQSPDGLPPEGFHYRWGKNQVDYGMDPRVVDDPRYRDEIVSGLKSLPSISLVMTPEDLFGEKRGVYSNAGEQGRESERPGSIELIHPDGRKGFQIDCGIRIRGGFSRMPVNPKHAFRLFFREEYGEPKLKYPLFGADAAQEHDSIDLRTFQNYSWSLCADPRATFLRDQFNRDLQRAMGQPAARGEFCHLYLNGQYWGLYNTCERPEASFAAQYFGGKKADYDVVKVDSGFTTRRSTYQLIATDGTMDAWARLYRQASAGLKDNARYFEVQGCEPDGRRNPEKETLLDVDNLIDYMLIIFWGGNLDAPISAFGGNRNPNNYHSIRRRTGGSGFKFFVWDSEHTMLDLETDRTGPFRTGATMEYSSPQWLWQQCVENAEFRLRVADRVHRHLSPGGVLHPGSLRTRFLERAQEIESAVIAESARWGDVANTFPMENVPARIDAQGKPITGPLNRDDDWRKEIRRLAEEYLPKRSDVVLGQLFAQGLVPDIEPPRFSPGTSADGQEVLLSSATSGVEIFYTLDGGDPRWVGGEIAPNALKSGGRIVLAKGQNFVRARARIAGDWSALSEYRR